MLFRRKRREELRVDLTAMIDVVFLLLIFFMISTTFIDAPGLAVRLPEASTTVSRDEEKSVRIYLTRDGEISIDDAKVSMAELTARLNAYGSRALEMTFLLNADTDARHGQVVELMDAAKVAGFGKLAIATEEKRTP
jgi:biopolymer transport protein ExbD